MLIPLKTFLMLISYISMLPGHFLDFMFHFLATQHNMALHVIIYIAVTLFDCLMGAVQQLIIKHFYI